MLGPMNYLTDTGAWTVAITTLLIASSCVVLHYQALVSCSRLLPRLTQHHRRRVLFTILAILVTHIAEIWLFAFGYYVLVAELSLGGFAGIELENLADYTYFSAMVYTTVGFGDILPIGTIRFMTGMEALTGLVMITWSASFTFLEMQRDWPRTQR